MLAARWLSEERFAAAQHLIQELLQTWPEDPDLWNGLGIALASDPTSTAQQQNQAIQAFAQALSLQAHGEVADNLGLALLADEGPAPAEQGPLLQAACMYCQNLELKWQLARRLRTLYPQVAEAFEAICQCYEMLQDQSPVNPMPLFELADWLQTQQQFERTETELLKFWDLFRSQAAYRDYLGRFYLAQAAPDKSLPHCLAATQLPCQDPLQNQNYRLNLAITQKQLGAYAEALALLEQLRQEAPKNPLVLYNLANVYLETQNDAQAEALYRQALESQPDLLQAQVNLAHLLIEKQDLEQALKVLNQVLQQAPDSPQAQIHRAHCLLALGQYAEGWKAYEIRHWYSQQKGYRWPGPVWQGEPLQGKHLHLMAEQGLGDMIQFVRFIPLLRQRFAPRYLSLQAPVSLHPLFRQLAGIDELLPHEAPAPQADLYLKTLSLAKLLEMTPENIPQPPYLRAPEGPLPQCLQVPAQDRRFKIALVWQSGKYHESTHQKRSLALAGLEPLLNGFPECQFWSLQKVYDPNEIAPYHSQILNLGDELHDFGDTARILQQMDLLISVDTSVVHLAGALNIPTWVLLAFAPDWRWGLHAESGPWYPSLKLFRQESPGDWSAPIQKLCQSLKAHLLNAQ